MKLFAIKLLTMVLHAITLFVLICAPSYVSAQHNVQELADRWSHGNYQVVDRVDGSILGFGRFAPIWMAEPDRVWRLDRDLWQQRSEPR